MNKFNFVRDGGCKLPPGFQFQPTDEEIVFQYLARKTFAFSLPASVIPEISISCFRGNPWELPGDSDQDRYFFSNKNINHERSIKRSCRATWGGFWKDTGAEKRIMGSKKMPIMGIKKTLVFWKGKYPRATKTNWIMHVYYIVLPTCILKKSSSQGSLIQIGNWMLCHVFLQKRSHERNLNADHHMPMEDSSDDSDASSSVSTSSSPYSDSSVLSEVSSSSSESNLSL